MWWGSEAPAAIRRRFVVMVNGSRIATRGLGETEPVASNETEAGRQANRRVEVAIYASREMQANAGKPGTR